MDALRSTVYIPLVELTDQPNQLFEVYCEKQNFGASELDNKSLDKDWHFVAAELRRIGLYDDGLLAVNSVRKLGLKLPLWAFYQRFKKYGWLDNQRLHYVNVVDCEGGSAQLGLAVALLLNASDSLIRYAIATGKLSNDTKKNQGHDYDVAIEVVGSVPEKLDLLIAKRKAKTLPEGRLYCFTPTHYKKEGQLYPVAELAQIKELADLQIEVKPIAWLSEAAKILQTDKSRYLPQDKWLAAGTGILSALFLTVSLYLSWWHYPIPLQILAYTKQNKAEPFLVCTNRDSGKPISYYDLENDGGIPELPVFNKENINYTVGIGFRLRAGQTPFTDQYYVSLIELAEKSGYKVFDRRANNKIITVSTAKDLIMALPMEEKANKSFEEEKVLFIALQRTPIAVDKINQQLAERFPEKLLDVLKARDFLVSQFPNSYTFAYRAIFSEPPCIKPSS